MRRKQLIAGAVTIAALAGGTAGAVAATDRGKATEDSVLADAAKRLGVGAEELRTALTEAEAAQLDAQLKADVQAGRLTQEQADAIRQHRQGDDRVLDLGPGGHGPGHGPGGPGHHGPFLLADAADVLGIGERALMERLHDGETLAAIAKAEGKTLAEVKAAVKQAATERLDAERKAGRITQAERDAAVERLDAAVQRLGDFRVHRRGPWDGDDGPRP